MPTVTGTRGVADRQLLATIPASTTVFSFSVSPVPVDGIGPAWVSVEMPISGIDYAVYSIFCPYQAVRPQNVPVTSLDKRVYAYWRGKKVYSWALVY